ncbi:GNAT family N-acetyltransferase [Undibacterium sp. RTI2.1]|uniref:GNAT family N-acetyltransferase n=1 Tax=unclassified Undibacterium TaxID=2630295 RepID=UPI002AB45BBC|nr:MULTISPECIES: GNAT family N-acetyltransferase [unclassified Undibacterium]MDY7537316.1 GNAT family N-acetyltransferase [Undibacterium sp. 5I1]MEB0032126.1 GNAT family N-acetyltransferase [Undibacterium sp. RTI2.1]MEB0118374.1 GNAT family N-acetyltransferase [Undibacterium sp. RTI2.2]MEB0231759.1 GNAT family N-acetyltransferase [Undibacterium sp. 10I3]MEB0259242.1 GNAT family N-acetyltransferase [Undibacterium sp. 5I1]
MTTTADKDAVRVTLGSWAELQKEAQAIRYDVFVIEQNIPVELEWDEMDAQCLHAVAYDAQGTAVGTGRLLPDGHIGRMAVRSAARGLGVGAAILQSLMQQARNRGDKAVKLNAQTSAEPFYARNGYSREGDVFEEAGIPHISMSHEF